MGQINNPARTRRLGQGLGALFLHTHVHVGRDELEEATALMTRFGEHALFEAAARASHSRSVGNVVHFCRWRQIERAIEMLGSAEPSGPVH